MLDYLEFFRVATGHSPYPFQTEFAEAEPLPHLLRAPTGAGKTATAILGWLWRRRTSPKNTPRRLVYCLPMRVLVEQSRDECAKWLDRLVLTEKVGLHVLMGGVDKVEWHLHPERPAILIGTQDMLLSRALNRGYAANRFHWPIDFGLLNSDCLWVFDEPQLMAGGVSTSAQLHGLRKALGTAGACPTVWMSATLEPGWLDTADFRGKFLEPALELTDADDDKTLPLHTRMTAGKTLAKLGAASEKDMRAVAAAVWKAHQPGTQTLVVLNIVDRAKALYEELVKLKKRDATPELLLIHSRFRPRERQGLNEALKDTNPGDRIVVATQVVEAGVDISSRTLFTEVCPWASVVQRVGRCNRTGHDGPGTVFWIDVDDKSALPYTAEQLDFARVQLAALEGQSVSPKALDDYKRAAGITLPFEHKHVLRRRDLLDLFDTAPDLSGNDIDVARFVRSDDPDSDVQVFWRDWTGEPDEASPQRLELCNVPIGQIRKFLEDRKPAFVWDHLDDAWKKLDAKQLRPGLVILVPVDAGGYSDRGWDPASKAKVTPYPPAEKEKPEGAKSDPHSAIPVALNVEQHTDNVCDQLKILLNEIDLPEFADTLRIAARWHDVGKAHVEFQAGMRKANPALAPDQMWAKSGTTGKLTYGRKHLRHELASALAALQRGLPFFVAYLIATHHGKVRLSIRSLPGEGEAIKGTPPELFALGVYHGDLLPRVDLGGDATWEAAPLDLTPMRLGGDASWTGRALELLAKHGPFKLAYLEAILRAADCRASAKEARGE